MMFETNGVNIPFIPIAPKENHVNETINRNNASEKFGDILSQEKIKFSGHAENRMQSRDLTLTPTEYLRLDEAISKAKSKNSKDALVMLDGKGILVNVPNKTVVTMFSTDQLNNNIVTQIDSVVFA